MRVIELPSSSSETHGGCALEESGHDAVELRHHDGGDIECRSIVLKSGLQIVRHGFQRIGSITAAQEVPQGIGDQKALWTDVLPLDDVDQFVKVQRLVAFTAKPDEERGKIGDAGGIQLLERRETGQSHAGLGLTRQEAVG